MCSAHCGHVFKEGSIANLIGALRVTMSADTAAFHAGMTKAERQAKQSGTAITKALGGIKAGLAGLAAGISVGLFVGMAKDALQFAGSLGELAQKTGTTVEQYQILTRAALAGGVAQGQLDAALVRLNKTLGDAQRGSETAIRAFKGLGISEDQLRSYEKGGDILPKVMEGVKNLGSASEQTSRSQEVMGRGAAVLLPILTQGAAGYNAMAAEAERAGLITAEQAAKADDAADSIDLLAYSLKTNLAVAVADNVGAVNTLIQALSELISFAGRAITKLGEFNTWYENYQDRQMAGAGLTEETRALGRRGIVTGASGRMNDVLKALVPGAFGPQRPQVPGVTGSAAQDLARPARGGGGKSAEQVAREAERAREQAERDRVAALRADYEFQTELRRGKMDELQAQQDLTEDYLARGFFATKLLALETEQERAALELAVQSGELSQAQADRILAQNAINDGLKQQRVELDIEDGKRAEVNRTEDQRYDIARRRLEGEASLAETARERREIEMRILDLAYEEERARLERIAAEARTFEEQTAARVELAALGDREAIDRAQVNRGTMGPMESFLSSLPDTAAKADEALEAVAANGLSSLIDGLAEASLNVEDLGKTFANIAKQIIADLIRIAIQKAVVGALSNALGSFAGFGGGGGDGGVKSGLAGIKGFARGGSGIIKGRGGIDTNLLSLNGRPLARVSHGERLTVDRDGGQGGGMMEIRPSPLFEVYVDGKLVQAAPGIMQGGAAIAGSNFAKSKKWGLAG